MGEEAIVLSGWIRPCGQEAVDVDSARKELEACGVEVGGWNAPEREFHRCRVSMMALDKLDPLWGKYIWGLS